MNKLAGNARRSLASLLTACSIVAFVDFWVCCVVACELRCLVQVKTYLQKSEVVPPPNDSTSRVES